MQMFWFLQSPLNMDIATSGFISITSGLLNRRQRGLMMSRMVTADSALIPHATELQMDKYY